jgi:P-type Ca2+ transporter type 2C
LGELMIDRDTPRANPPANADAAQVTAWGGLKDAAATAIHWASQSPEQVIAALDTNPERGLSTAEAEARLTRVGPNLPFAEEEESIWEEILELFREPMILLLIAVMVVYFLLGEHEDALIMLGAIVPIAAIEVLQETRTARAIRALKALVSPTAAVLRDGQVQTIPSTQMVPGDILLLDAGDIVAADARLLTANNLQVDESALTGEAMPQTKDAQASVTPSVPLFEQPTMVFGLTAVQSGAGRAVVVETGPRTEYGQIGKSLAAVEIRKTPLQERSETFTRRLAIAGFLVTLGVFGLGLLQGLGVLPALLRGLSLAMAAIPEELPIILTVFLALGVRDMTRRHALIRKLTAVETLGSVTTICTDKTGTLTEGQLSVSRLFWRGRDWSAEDAPPAVVSEIAALFAPQPSDDWLDQAVHRYLVTHNLPPPPQIVAEFPFDRQRRVRTTVQALADGQYHVVTRGAPEQVLAHSVLSDADRTAAPAVNEAFASAALRVIGVAEKMVPAIPASAAEAETGLTFVGLLGLTDPLRSEVPAAIAAAHTAGVRVMLITGDQPLTATAIARAAGLIHPDRVVLGHELADLDEAAIARQLQDVTAVARALPLLKLRIVRALQAQGQVVAMTGDGVNDAPALKAADIGIAMGRRGTEVARGAAPMVLADDNFATIVAAMAEGRRIYANIQKAINFFAGSKVAILGFVLLNSVLALPLALLPIHIVWLELVVDPMSSAVYQAEPADADLMRQPPRPRSEALVPRSLLIRILAQGAAILAAAFGGYVALLQSGTIERARTVAFSVLVLALLLLVLVNRSPRPFAWRVGQRANPLLLAIVALSVVLQVAIVSWPPLQRLFTTTTLSLTEWALALGLAALSTIWFEGVKALSARQPK